MKCDDLAELLAPTAPPCFSTRSDWLSYVRSSASANHEGDAQGPLKFIRGVIALDTDAGLTTAQKLCGQQPFVIEKGKVVQFNRDFSFCAECLPSFAASKRREGKCRPSHLLEVLKPKEAT